MFALILTLCSYAGCNSYFVETDNSWHSVQECKPSIEIVRNKILTDGLEAYLIPMGLQHEAEYNQDWDLSCEAIPDNLIP